MTPKDDVTKISDGLDVAVQVAGDDQDALDIILTAREVFAGWRKTFSDYCLYDLAEIVEAIELIEEIRDRADLEKYAGREVPAWLQEVLQ